MRVTLPQPNCTFLIRFIVIQITEKLELLLTEREGLYATWEDHKTELDQAYDLHIFLRDAKQIDTLTSTQEVKCSVPVYTLVETEDRNWN